MLPFRTMVMVVAAVGLLSFFATAPLSAAPRVALVIGNASYEHAAALANPLNDAADMGAALERLGFAVTRLENGSDAEMRRGLNEFRRAASASEVAVVFYAGHGIEVDGRNFLVPVDARLASDQDVEYEAIPLELAQRAVERASGLRLVILDACRENPFAVSMQRAGATRSIGRGLARVEPSGETLVAYAAKEGTVASDGDGRNSPYSEALLRFLEEPNLEVMFMLRKVRDAVLASTGGSQEPFWYGSLSSKGVYLAAGPEPEPSPVAQPPVAETPRVTASNHREDRYWDSVKDSADPADLEAYLERYPNGTYETLARNRLKRLQDKPADAEPSALDGASTSASDGVSVSGRLEAERLAAEREFWASVKGSDHPADIRAYLDQYPDGTYEVLARNRLKRLEGTSLDSEPETETVAVVAVPEASQNSEPEPEAVATEPTREGSADALLSPESVEVALGLTRAQRAMVQRGLAALKFDVGPADGVFGPRTRAAIGKWQLSRGESATEYMGSEQAETLLSTGEATHSIQFPQEPGDILSMALQAAQRVDDARNRTYAFVSVAQAQAETGDRRGATQSLSDARAAAQRVDDARNRTYAFVSVAQAQAETGDRRGATQSFSDARAAAQRVEDARDPTYAFVSVAQAQAETGDRRGATQSFSDARAAAQRVEDAGARVYTFVSIAQAQAETGDARGSAQSFSDARRVGAQRGNEHQRFLSYISVAEGQAEAGDVQGATQSFSDARAAAQRVSAPSFRFDRFLYIAKAQAEVGDTRGLAQSLSDARATAQRIESGYGRAYSFVRLAKSQAGDARGSAQSLSDARAAARSQDVDYEYQRAQAYAIIAVAQAEAGDARGAAQSLSDARAAQQRSTDMNNYGTAHDSIARAQASVGDIQGALANAQSPENKDARLSILAHIAETQAKAGDFQSALVTAESIDGGWRARALERIAEAQVIAGDFQGAVATVQMLADEDQHAWRISTIVNAQVTAGEIKGALTNAQWINDEDTRARSVSHIAQAQAEAGEIKGALATAQRIERDYSRAVALAGIAGVLVRMKNGAP